MQKGNMLKVPVSGQVVGIEESEALEECGNAKQYAPGRRVEKFEHEFAAFVGKKYGVFVNSGSSANLLAVTAWIKNKTQGITNFGKGYTVLLPAVSFPTTINPYLQNGVRVEIFDVEIETLQPNISPGFGVHTLGNYCEGLTCIEDSCDAMFPGQYNADLQTFSFYPAHFMTTGEGGMVTTDNPDLYRLMKSLRDWGRDCWCMAGNDDTCGRRFTQQFGDMPEGYDHKYIYTNIGYNLNGTEMAAAVGLAQLQKLPTFLETRKRNFYRLFDGILGYSGVFILPKTTLPGNAWFGFPLTIREDAKFTRRQIVDFLTSHGIGTRPVFAGNIIRQPAYKDARISVVGSLANANIITERSFWVGCWHGLNDEQIDYTIATIKEFCDNLD